MYYNNLRPKKNALKKGVEKITIKKRNYFPKYAPYIQASFSCSVI